MVAHLLPNSTVRYLYSTIKYLYSTVKYLYSTDDLYIFNRRFIYIQRTIYIYSTVNILFIFNDASSQNKMILVSKLSCEKNDFGEPGAYEIEDSNMADKKPVN